MQLKSIYRKPCFLNSFKFSNLRKFVFWKERHVLILSRKSVFIDTVLLIHSWSFLVYGINLIFLTLRYMRLWICNPYTPFNISKFQGLALINHYTIFVAHSNYRTLYCTFPCNYEIPYEQSLQSGSLCWAHSSGGLMQRNQLIQRDLPPLRAEGCQ